MSLPANIEPTATMTSGELVDALCDARHTLHDLLSELKWRSRVGEMPADLSEKWTATIRSLADEIHNAR
jgi:hypothetical protein